VVDYIPSIFDKLADELGVSLGAAAPLKLEGAGKDAVSLDTLKDMILFLADNAAGLTALADYHVPSATVMHQRGMEVTVAAMYEAFIPALAEELRSYVGLDGPLGEDARALELRVKWSREMFLKLVRRLISVSCIEPLLEKAQEFAGQNCPLVDDYFQIMHSCSNEQLFMEDYLRYFPLEEDLELFDQCDVKTDEMTKNYVLDALKKIVKHRQETVRFPEPRFPEPVKSGPPAAPPASPVQFKAPKKRIVTGAKLESLISQVTDLLPDLGRGFVHASLDHFEYDSEQTINAILEDHLPGHLKQMRRETEVWVTPDADDDDKVCEELLRIKSIKEVGEMDGDLYPLGKGFGLPGVDHFKKNSEKMQMFNDALLPGHLKREADLWGTGDANEEEDVDEELLKIKSIHKGKRDDLKDVLNRRPDFTQAERDRYWHYGSATEFLPSTRIADELDDDDEYDDTYDAEPEFRPEGVSQHLDEKPGHGGGGGGRGSVRGAPRGAGQDDETLRNRRKKEQNKSVSGNHNRRAQAQWKRRQC
ncbi:unnamed protein product, partial [Notodromas monacha]